MFTTHDSSPVTPRTRPFELGRDQGHFFRFFIREAKSGRILTEISRPEGGGPVTYHPTEGESHHVLTTTAGVYRFFADRDASLRR